VVQALLLMNGKKMTEAVNASRSVRFAMESSKPLDVLYLSALSRPPSDKEREAFNAAMNGAYATVYLKDKERNKLYRDVLWALFNSNEFILNH
jgi:hypothetical protein